MADRRGTHALMSKVRAADRRLERLEQVDKPWQPWRLQLDLTAHRAGDLVARLTGAVVERGDFRLGPIDLELRHGDRLAVVGPNGAGKTTLLRALLGELPLVAGSREVGPGIRLGELEQRRSEFSGREPLLERFSRADRTARGRGAHAPGEVRARRRRGASPVVLALAGRAHPGRASRCSRPKG